MNKKTALACGLAAAIVALSGCTPAIYTVGGTIPSKNPSKGATKAQFSLSGDSCDGLPSAYPEGVATFTYHDKSDTTYNPGGKGIGLQMTGPVLFVTDCSNPTIEGEADFCAGTWNGEPEATIDYLLESCPLLGGASTAPVKFFVAIYTSTNKRYPGEGLVWGCVQDNGQGKNASFKDKAVLIVPTDVPAASDNGPYAGYSNSGSVQGNVATYACPEPPPV